MGETDYLALMKMADGAVYNRPGPWAELELEIIQPHMAQQPVLRGEVGACALRVRSVPREDAWASAGVQGA